MGEVKHDRLYEFQVDKIVEELLRLLTSFQYNAMMDLWGFLQERFFTRLQVRRPRSLLVPSRSSSPFSPAPRISSRKVVVRMRMVAKLRCARSHAHADSMINAAFILASHSPSGTLVAAILRCERDPK
jgi:hypothetical protein